MAPAILATTYLHRHDHQLTAVGTILLTAAAVYVFNRWLAGRGVKLAAAVTGGSLSQGADTRLRFMRRAVDAVIVTIGVALALSQFTALDHLGRTVLASSAIAAAVVGFAARQALANAIAGILLAITQPLRIGDAVAFEGETGIVEDVKLTSTWLRTPTDTRVVIPNERLAAGVLRNDSIITPTVAVEASVWLPHGHDPIVAVEAVRAAAPDLTVRIAETTAEGVRLLVIGSPTAPARRVVAEAEIREAAMRAIHAAEG